MRRIRAPNSIGRIIAQKAVMDPRRIPTLPRSGRKGSVSLCVGSIPRQSDLSRLIAHSFVKKCPERCLPKMVGGPMQDLSPYGSDLKAPHAHPTNHNQKSLNFRVFMLTRGVQKSHEVAQTSLRMLRLDDLRLPKPRSWAILMPGTS